MFIAGVKIMLGSPGAILSGYIFGNDYNPALHKIVTTILFEQLKNVYQIHIKIDAPGFYF